MDQSKENKLVRKFPELYKQYGGDMTETCMHWGFECGDGWFDLLLNLSEQINKTAKQAGVRVEATQVKEKFGTLRFYYTLFPGEHEPNFIEKLEDKIDRYIDEAEKISEKTCETCGKPGILNNSYWLSVRCFEHR